MTTFDDILESLYKLRICESEELKTVLDLLYVMEIYQMISMSNYQKFKTMCSKGDQCSFRHESNDRAEKSTSKVVTSSESSMTRERSTSRKRSVRDRSETDRILRQSCSYKLKDSCTRSPCEY